MSGGICRSAIDSTSSLVSDRRWRRARRRSCPMWLHSVSELVRLVPLTGACLVFIPSCVFCHCEEINNLPAFWWTLLKVWGKWNFSRWFGSLWFFGYLGFSHCVCFLVAHSTITPPDFLLSLHYIQPLLYLRALKRVGPNCVLPRWVEEGSWHTSSGSALVATTPLVVGLWWLFSLSWSGAGGTSFTGSDGPGRSSN